MTPGVPLPEDPRQTAYRLARAAWTLPLLAANEARFAAAGALPVEPDAIAAD